MPLCSLVGAYQCFGGTHFLPPSSDPEISSSKTAGTYLQYSTIIQIVNVLKTSYFIPCHIYSSAGWTIFKFYFITDNKDNQCSVIFSFQCKSLLNPTEK
jgi:hypothetical protein